MDIVEQLRKSANIVYEQDGYAFRLGLQNEAADEIERLREESRLYWDAFQKAANEVERLRKELADHLADVKICSCKQRENDINQLFEELSK
jgi:hypothetical protein